MADGQITAAGYQGNLGFWGTQGNTRQWWNQDMADAGQALYMDPQTGLQTGTMPKELLQSYKDAAEDERKSRGGFMATLASSFKDVMGATDKVLSNVAPGPWSATKSTGKALWYPVDKLASGAYWLYSEGVSQPLSTVLLQAGKAELAEGGFWGGGLKVLGSGDEWSSAYHEAEHTSPAQAFMNYENTAEASGDGTLLSGVTAGGADNLDQKQKEAVKRNTERFLYDTEYWRDKQGWTYTAGTGSIDFVLSMGADPAYAALKGISAGTKAARAIKGTAQLDNTSRSISGVNMLAEKVGGKIGGAMAKTPEEASRSKGLSQFYDWAEGKSAAEIAQHPIWGQGRKANPERDRLSQLFAGTSREEKPLIFRFAAGDNSAIPELAAKNADTVAQIGKLSDNRALVDSVKFDADMLQHFIGKETGEAVAEGSTKSPRLMEPPYPRPTEPGPRQQGWDKTYGDLAKQADTHQQAASSIAGLSNGVRPMSGAAATSQADILRAQEWKANQLDTMTKQLEALQADNAYYADVLGKSITSVDEFTVGSHNLFGTVSSMYRQTPLALRNSEKIADKGVTRMSTGVKDYGKAAPDSGLVSRVLRNGFYSPAVRVMNSFGDRMPQTFIDHNAEDAYQRVTEMVKRVPGLDQEARLGMIRSYSMAGDKISRSKELDKIHGAVVEHMASRYDVDATTARQIDQMIKDGQISTLAKLTNQVPNQNMFSAAREAATTPGQPGKRVDMVEDNEGLIVAPMLKSQLTAGQPLLDVRELDLFLKKNSGLMNSMRASGARASDAVAAVGDSLNSLWKASTLLRPGYTLRSMSDEQAASAVKFGLMASILGSAEGGVNFALNRGQQVKALIGKGSYTSALGTGKGRVRILDEAGLKAAESQGLATERIKLSKAWPMINNQLSMEREGIAEAQKLLDAEKASKSPRADVITQLNERIADHNNVISEYGDYAKAVLQEATDSKGRRLGEMDIEHAGQTIPGAFSSKWENPIPRDQITSAFAMETMFARSEAIANNRLIKTGNWTTINPDRANAANAALHMDAWDRAINLQLGQDDLARLVASDPTLKAAKQWLKTADGKAHVSTLGPWARDQDRLLTSIQSTIDQYVPRATGLQEKLANGEKITEQDLRANIAEDAFPPVHGEEINGLTKDGVLLRGGQAIDKIIEKGFKLLGTLPNDVMARQPIYLRAQEARMRQAMDLELGFRKEMGLDETIDMATMNKLLERSDKMARKDISQVVYDPTRTTASEALRFVTPFFSAHVDGLQRWAGLISETPQYLGAAAKIYNAPVAANLVTDSQGNHVDQNGYADVYDPTTGEKTGRKFVPLADRVLNLRVPDGTTNVRGKTSIPIKMSSLNTILPGDPWFNPGTGPYAQIAATELARQSPGVGDFLQWAKVIPYGPTEGGSFGERAKNALTPAYMKDFGDVWDAYTSGDEGSPGNEAYQKAYLAEYQRQVADHANGGPAPDMKKVAHNAKQFMFLEALGNYVSPARSSATPLTGSPYQFFLDQYKAMQEVDPKNAQAQFFNKYGEDYFVFTSSLSKSMGIQSSLSADKMADRFGDLISEDPDLAPLIVGDVYNKGNFSTSVYRKQMDEILGGERVREKVTAGAAINENQKDLGWQKYGQLMDMLDAEVIRSGFKSYSDKGAEPFAEVKRQMVASIADGNDAWYEDYGTTNTTKLPIRIKAMQRLVDDPDISKDPFRNDLNGLRFYLSAREQLKAQLAQRGLHSVSFDIQGRPTGEAADVGSALRTLQLSLVNSNLEFADVFHRYLENDDLS